MPRLVFCKVLLEIPVEKFYFAVTTRIIRRNANVPYPTRLRNASNSLLINCLPLSETISSGKPYVENISVETYDITRRYLFQHVRFGIRRIVIDLSYNVFSVHRTDGVFSTIHGQVLQA